MKKEKEDYYKGIQAFLMSGQYEQLREYLRKWSNLPGARANLELAREFGRVFEDYTVSDKEWTLLTELSRDPSPTGEPGEILPFCAVHGFAACFPAQDEKRREEIFRYIVNAMLDKRWRMHEAAANAGQIIGMKEPERLLEWLNELMDMPDLFVKRGIVAVLADPDLLKNAKIAERAITLCDLIFTEVASFDAETYKTEEYNVLRKGLEYAPSVLVAARPEEGFNMLKRHAAGNEQLQKIIRKNLKKKRLLEKYPEQVSEAQALMG